MKWFSILAAAALAASLTWSPARAAPDATQEKACRAYVLSSVPGGGAALGQVISLIRTIADGPVRACRPDLKGVPTTPDELDRVAAEVKRRQAAHDCDQAPSLPVCLALSAAADRANLLPSLQDSKTPAGQYRLAADFHWDTVYGAFGSGPNGASLYRLVVRAAGLPAPKEDFADYIPPAGKSCDDPCRISVADVLGQFALLDELDLLYRANVVQGRIQKQAAVAKLTEARWNAYLFGGGDARVQLPWELLANSALYKLTVRGPAPGDYPEPPSTALVLMHPSVGLAFKTAKGTDANLVGVVELAGITHWSYDPVTGARKNEWGLSGIAAYQPRKNGHDWGYGALLRTPLRGLNFAWARTRVDTGYDDQWMFSFDPTTLLPALGKGSCLFGVGVCN